MPDSYSPIEKDEARAAGVAAGLGCSIVVSIIASIVGGLLLDRWLGTTPWLTLGGVALGMILAGYQLYELSQFGQKDKAPRIVTRQIQKVATRAPKTTQPTED